MSRSRWCFIFFDISYGDCGLPIIDPKDGPGGSPIVSFFTSFITRWTIFLFFDLLNLICICANGSADGRGAVAGKSRDASRDIVLPDQKYVNIHNEFALRYTILNSVPGRVEDPANVPNTLSGFGLGVIPLIDRFTNKFQLFAISR